LRVPHGTFWFASTGKNRLDLELFVFGDFAAEFAPQILPFAFSLLFVDGSRSNFEGRAISYFKNLGIDTLYL